ncbi:hypothetical protein BaRGS_00003708 [Batillaria attramentaria]|uniref:Fibrinogen C-terminal domain-containing protein n=1 Tax=Batillaria attramentaria TaxID=370345 RepID=A0ABD0M160_9CAEN
MAHSGKFAASVTLFISTLTATAASMTHGSVYGLCPRGYVYDGLQLEVLTGHSEVDCAARCSLLTGCVGANVCPTGRGDQVACTLIGHHNPARCGNLDAAGSPACVFMQKTTQQTAGSTTSGIAATDSTSAQELTTDSATTQAGTTTESTTEAVAEQTTELICLNGGTLNIDSCTCTPQYSGRTCHRRVRDCTEVYENGYTTSMYDGVYVIQPISAPTAFQVKCEFAWFLFQVACEFAWFLFRVKCEFAWFLFQVKCEFAYGIGVTYPIFRPSSSDFNKNWLELKSSFGDPNGWDYFIGLQNLHYLLSQGSYQNQVYFEYTDGGQTKRGSAYYDNFTIASEAEFYRLSYDTFSTDTSEPADDGFPASQPVLFSAVGQDTNGCAAANSAAGWYGADCSTKSGVFATTVVWPVYGVQKSVDELHFNIVRMSPFYE